MDLWHLNGRCRFVTCTVVLGGLLVISSCAQRRSVVIGQEGRRRIGMSAPDFELNPLAGGGPVKLSAQRGKTVMLVFWSRGGHALPLVDRAYRQFGSRGLVIWSINYEEPVAIRNFIISKGYTFPVLHDPGGKVSREYLESGNTTAVVVGPSGTLVKYKQNFFGEDDFWKMLSDLGFRRQKPLHEK
jgi:hypothetical protein